jgi:hypothetical protein
MVAVVKVQTSSNFYNIFINIFCPFSVSRRRNLLPPMANIPSLLPSMDVVQRMVVWM